MYIINGNEASYFEGEDLRTVEQLPSGAWGIGYKPMTNAPYFYRINDYKTGHGKIYGDSVKIASHVIEAYKKEATKNVGALFSGKKGLGKSLTIRLIVEQLIKERPVIVVDQYTDMLPSILSDCKDCVIILDEFEKMLRGKGEGGMTPQESLLSVLDGTKSLSHNLYLLSVNDVFSLDENMISRPGRIRYHFRYNNISKATVEDFCKDNLVESRWNEIEAITEAIQLSSVQSLDIVGAVVNEMNLFPETPLTDIMSYLNVGENKFSVEITTTYSVDGHTFTETFTTQGTRSGVMRLWLNDDTALVSMKVKDIGYLPQIIPLSNIKVDRWGYTYLDEITAKADPYWEQFKDEDGDYYVELSSGKHKVEIASLSIKRCSEFGVF